MMLRFSIFHLIILFSAFFTTKVAGQQQQYTVKLYDKLSNKAIKDVKVSLSDSTSTKTNVLGYFQLAASPGDTVFVESESYRSQIIVLPQQAKFKAGIEIGDEFLKFEGGYSVFRKEFLNSLSYPGPAVKQRIEDIIYVEILVGSDGKSNMAAIHNDTDKVFGRAIEAALQSVPAGWDKVYEGKTLLLPVNFKLRDSNEKVYESPDDLLAKVDKVLQQVIVEGAAPKGRRSDRVLLRDQ